MAAGVLDRVPVDEITARAAEMRPGRAVLTVVAAALFGVGWACAIVFATLWKCGRWVAAAFLVGYGRAHGPTKSQIIAQQKATIAAQEMRLSRFSG
jgi:hypothetical protein